MVRPGGPEFFPEFFNVRQFTHRPLRLLYLISVVKRFLYRNSVYGNIGLDANFIEKDHGRSSQIDYWNQRLGDGEVTRLLDLHHLQR